MAIDTPNDQMRLVALGARFAVEQQYQEQVVRLANERDQALAQVAQMREQVEQMTAPTDHADPPDVEPVHDHTPDVICTVDCARYGIPDDPA